MAGTVAAPFAGPSELPPAASPDAPEPSWTERHFARAASGASPAPARSSSEPLPHGSPEDRGVCDLLADFAAQRRDPVATLAALRTRAAVHPSGGDAILAAIAAAEPAAQDSAARWAAGTARPLEGVPFGVKDIIDCAGAPATSGSHLTGDRVAHRDATVVARLRAAGAIPVAMLATTEFACGSAHNPRYGAVANPWDPSRWTGGSSTGSGGALAARLLPLALGTDTGGSIRIPAAACGITGLKPTRGLVPRTGVAPLSWTLDHVGPMARSAADLMPVMAVLAGPDGEDHLAVGAFDGARARASLAGLRIGVPGGWFTTLVDGAVLAAFEAALKTFEGLGAVLVPVDLGPVETAHGDGYLIVMSELASLQEPELDRMDRFDVGTRARIEQGRLHSAIDYLRALRRRPGVIARVLGAMEGVDVVVTPGMGCEAPILADLTAVVDGAREPLQKILPRNTMLFDYTGQPALMLPAGFGDRGLPVAIQIVGKLFDDALCLSVGAAFQQATDFHRHAPPEPSAGVGRAMASRGGIR